MFEAYFGYENWDEKLRKKGISCQGAVHKGYSMFGWVSLWKFEIIRYKWVGRSSKIAYPIFQDYVEILFLIAFSFVLSLQLYKYAVLTSLITLCIIVTSSDLIWFLQALPWRIPKVKQIDPLNLFFQEYCLKKGTFKIV